MPSLDGISPQAHAFRCPRICAYRPKFDAYNNGSLVLGSLPEGGNPGLESREAHEEDPQWDSRALEGRVIRMFCFADFR